MSDIIRYEIQPKEIYEDGFDDNLNSFEISEDFESNSKEYFLLPNDSSWYTLPTDSVYVINFARLTSELPINLSINASNTFIGNCYDFVCRGEITAIYAQNTGTADARIYKEIYGTNGIRTPTPAPDPWNTITVTTDTVVSTSNSVILCNAVSNTIEITLPTLVISDNGKIYTVKKTDASANAVTVVSAGGELIDGSASLTISTQNASYTVIWNGTSWDIV